MIVTIHQPEAYGGYVGLIQKIAASDLFIIYTSCQFEKNNYQNRNQIMQFGKNVFTSIPIELPQGHNTLLKDVLIKPEYYHRVIPKLRKQLAAEYSKCPFYEDGMFMLENAWAKEYSHLVDLNSHMILSVLEYLGIDVQYKISDELDLYLSAPGKSTEHLVQLCCLEDADVYLSGQGGKNYMDESLFSSANIKVQYFEPKVVPYQQKNYKEFVPYLCVFDGIFNHGKEFKKYVCDI